MSSGLKNQLQTKYHNYIKLMKYLKAEIPGGFDLAIDCSP